MFEGLGEKSLVQSHIWLYTTDWGAGKYQIQELTIISTTIIHNVKANLLTIWTIVLLLLISIVVLSKININSYKEKTYQNLSARYHPQKHHK